jgi:hypothetical protein
VRSEEQEYPVKQLKRNLLLRLTGVKNDRFHVKLREVEVIQLQAPLLAWSYMINDIAESDLVNHVFHDSKWTEAKLVVWICGLLEFLYYFHNAFDSLWTPY